jgi:O-antigen ligase
MQRIHRWRPAAALELSPKATNILSLFLLTAAAVVIGFQVRPGTYLSAVILGFGLLAGCCILLLRPGMSLGFNLLLVSAVLLPFESDTRPVNLSLILVALLSSIWVTDMALTRKLPRLPRRVSLPLILFMASAVLSFVLGQFPRFPTESAPLQAQIGGLSIFLLSGAAFLLIAVRLTTLLQLKRLTAVFLISGAFMVLLLVVPGLEQRTAQLIRPTTVGSLFWTWLVAIAFSQALLNRDLRPHTRLGLLLLTGLVFYKNFFLTFTWVSGWLPPIIALAVILALSFPRLAFAMSLVALPFVLMSLEPIFNPVLSNEQYSMETRFVAWKIVLKIVQVSPLVGLGPANYFYYTPLFPILGWYVTFSSHNNYLDILAQTGLVGFLLFSWFLFEVGRLAWRLRNSFPTGFSRAYVHGVLAGLTATLVAGMLGDWLLPFVYNVGLRGFRSSLLAWVFLGGLAALARFHPSLQTNQKRPNEQSGVLKHPVMRSY